MNKLDAFTDDQLLEEVIRRRNADDTAHRGDIMFCDQCEHFVPWTEKAEVPKKYNPCSFGHDMQFRTPIGYENDWGFFRRVCPDRLETQHTES